MVSWGTVIGAVVGAAWKIVAPMIMAFLAYKKGQSEGRDHEKRISKDQYIDKLDRAADARRRVRMRGSDGMSDDPYNRDKVHPVRRD